MSSDPGLHRRPPRIAWWRDVVAASAAAAAWWGVNAVNAAVTSRAAVPARFAQLVLPASIPGTVWAGPVAWAVVASVCSALAVGAAVLVGFRLLSAWAGRWFVVIVAAGLGGFVLGVGVLAAQWPPPAARELFFWFPDRIQPAVLWGLVWGWVPVLAGVLLTRRGTHRAGRAAAHPGWQVALASAAAVLLLAGTAVTGVYAHPAIPTSTSAASPVGGSGAPQAGSQAAPAPSPARPVPPTVSGPVPASAGPCRSGQVTLTVALQGGVTGHLVAQIIATNVSSTACVVDGYPDLAFGTASGRPVSVRVVHGATFTTPDPGPARVGLAAHGGGAIASLSWTPGTGGAAGAAGEADVAVAPGKRRATARLRDPIQAGDTVQLTAWQSSPF